MEAAKDNQIDALYGVLESAHEQGLYSVVDRTWGTLRDYTERAVPQTEEEVALQADHIIIDTFRSRTSDPSELDALFENVAQCESGILPYYDHPEEIFTGLSDTLNNASEALASYTEESPVPDENQKASEDSVEEVMTGLLVDSGIPPEIAAGMGPALVALTDKAIAEGRETTSEEIADLRSTFGLTSNEGGQV